MTQSGARLDGCPVLPRIKVRYILADTPERGQCCYGESTERNRQPVEVKRVGLQRDESELDSYNRLLRYVWVDGVDVGSLLIREGFAKVVIYDDRRHLCPYLDLQDQALSEVAGMWGACQYPTPTPYPGCGS